VIWLKNYFFCAKENNNKRVDTKVEKNKNSEKNKTLHYIFQNVYFFNAYTQPRFSFERMIYLSKLVIHFSYISLTSKSPISQFYKIIWADKSISAFLSAALVLHEINDLGNAQRINNQNEVM
jgi:hypothetical protein